MYIVYGKPGCAYCDRAKMLLDRDDFEYEYIDVTEDSAARQMLIQRNFRQVPQIYKGDEHIGGYAELVEHLDLGG